MLCIIISTRIKIMIIDELKKANIEALKNKETNKRNIISVVMNKYKLLEVEAKASNKIIGDEEMSKIIQKTLKELQDEKAGYIENGNTERAALISEQEDTIKMYMPKQLDEAKIREIIESLDDKSIPNVMKYFKANYAGNCDMGLVNKIARQY